MLTAVASTLECLRPFFRGRSGTLPQKLNLLVTMRRNFRNVQNCTAFGEQLVMLAALLSLPREVPGVAAECGAYKGGATVNLSLACRLAGRQLYVFDSFAGLPEPRAEDRRHTLPVAGEAHVYSKGSFACSLEQVKLTVERYGAPEVCHFVPGFFDATLCTFHHPVAFVYCEADLRASVETCLRYLWPLLQDDCPFFTHEDPHLEIASLFYDAAFWNGSPPGLIGAGSGLGLSPNGHGFFGSAIGYSIKNPAISRESLEDA